MDANTGRVETIRESKTQNRIAVRRGAAAAVVASLVFFFLPAIVPMQQFRKFMFEVTGAWINENPLTQLRPLGLAVGALIAGYYSIDRTGHRDWMTSMKNGVFAALIGLGVMYVLYAGSIAVNYGSAILTNPTLTLNLGHVLDIIVIPLIFLFPLLPVAIFEGFIFGAVGNVLRLVVLVGATARS